MSNKIKSMMLYNAYKSYYLSKLCWILFNEAYWLNEKHLYEVLSKTK